MEHVAFQDESHSRGNCCGVCGNDSPHGLYIKSYREGDESVRTRKAERHQSADWPHAMQR